jgi:TRAP transporter TAXI family solute receptor
MIGRRTFGLTSLAVIGTAVSARADVGSFKLGTASAGGSFPLYGAAFVDLLKLVDPTLSIRDVPTRGPHDNLRKLERGELDLGLVTGEVLHEALEGIGRPPTTAKVVAAAFPIPGMFAVLPDSRFRRIADLKGRPVVWNPRTSGPAVQSRYVMDGLGLSPERDFESIYTQDMTSGPAMVMDRRAAAIWGGGLRWPGFVAIAESARGARFVPPSADEIELIRAKYPFLAPLTVPAGLYRGQRDPIATVGSWSVLMARPDFPDESGRRIVAALGKAEQGRLLPRQLVQTTAKNTLAAVPEQEALQPGVREYYRDQGLL